MPEDTNTNTKPTPTTRRYLATLLAGGEVIPNPAGCRFQRYRADALVKAAEMAAEKTGRKIVCVESGPRGGTWASTWALAPEAGKTPEPRPHTMTVTLTLESTDPTFDRSLIEDAVAEALAEYHRFPIAVAVDGDKDVEILIAGVD